MSGKGGVYTEDRHFVPYDLYKEQWRAVWLVANAVFAQTKLIGVTEAMEWLITKTTLQGDLGCVNISSCHHGFVKIYNDIWISFTIRTEQNIKEVQLYIIMKSQYYWSIFLLLNL